MTYDDLKTAVFGMMNKESSRLETYFPVAVRLAEQNVFQALPELDCFKTEMDLSMNADNAGKIPIDFAGATEEDLVDLEIIRTVTASWTDADGNDKSAVLEKRIDDFEDLWDVPATSSDPASDPKFYTITGRSASSISISIFPAFAGRSYDIRIRGFGETEKLDPTDGSNSETWLSKNAFDALQYGTALHGATFLKDLELAAGYKASYDAALSGLAKQAGLQYKTEAEEGSMEDFMANLGAEFLRGRG